MTIIHYFLGFPPLRSGGMTRYAVDLMQEQVKLGLEVIALYPNMNFVPFNKKIRFTYQNSYKGIKCYSLKGALPIPLLYGIKDPVDYIIDLSAFDETIRSFFLQIKPDVVHVHSLMGLPIEVLQIAKQMGIKTVFTSHDYFGLCPKVNFINSHGVLCSDIDDDKCSICNACAWPRWMLWIRNSKLMILLKKFKR